MAVFAGGARIGSTPVADAAANTLWKFYGLEKFDALTLATEDIKDVDGIPADVKKNLVVANVTTNDGKPLAPPVIYRTAKLADGRTVRVAFIGLKGKSPYTYEVPGAPKPPSAYTETEPKDALLKVLPEARKKADVVVVMYATTREPARQLVRDVPGIDVMIVGLEGAVDQKPEMIGTTAVVQNGDRGRYASQLGITFGPDKKPTAYDLCSVPLDTAYGDDPAAMKLVQEYRTKMTVPVAVATPPAMPPATANPANPSNPTNAQPATQPGATATPQVPLRTARAEYAGSYACSDCHAKEFNQWRSTKHASAMKALETAQGGQPARRVDCVPCHVVGYGKPGGYTITNPRWDLRDVGCEACHGPANAHVIAKQNDLPDNSGIVLKPSRETCESCHNKDNDPNFNYDTYLPHVMHNFHGTLPKLPDAANAMHKS